MKLPNDRGLLFPPRAYRLPRRPEDAQHGAGRQQLRRLVGHVRHPEERLAKRRVDRGGGAELLPVGVEQPGAPAAPAFDLGEAQVAGGGGLPRLVDQLARRLEVAARQAGGTVFGGTVFGGTVFGGTVFGGTVFGGAQQAAQDQGLEGGDRDALAVDRVEAAVG